MEKELETRRTELENAEAVCQRLNVDPNSLAYALDAKKGKYWIGFKKSVNYLFLKGQREVNISIPIDANELAEIKGKTQSNYPDADEGEMQRREAIYFLQQYVRKEKNPQKVSICNLTIADLEFLNVSLKLMENRRVNNKQD
jgi:hypothetical protein